MRHQQARAVVLAGGVALVALLGYGWASDSGGLSALLAACCPGLLSPAVTGQAAMAPAAVPVSATETTGVIPRVGEQAPDAAFETGTQSIPISSLRGKKTMLWLLSTWCGTCAQGVLGLAKAEPDLARAGIQILALRNYRNGGFPGP